ncbi:MAG: glycosyltransferase [Candidatus Omnitrophica bacterium]|nr:glycosyltransferase [Candidatus Omnitrophota bacterium]
MKIAILIDVFPHPNLTFIIEQIVALVDKGFEVDIFSFIHRKKGPIHPLVNKYHLIERTCYISYPKNIFFRFFKAAWFLFLTLFRDPLGIIKTLNFAKFGRDALSLKLFFSYLVFREKKTKYDIIHAHFGPSGNIAAKLRGLNIGGKIIVSFHGYDFSQYVKRYGKEVYDYLFNNTDIMLTLSEYAKRKLSELSNKTEKIISLSAPINVNDFRFQTRYLKKGEIIKILTVARLVEKKGLYFSIKAMEKVLKKHQNLKYTIIGEGPLRKELTDLIHSLDCQEKIVIFSITKYAELIEEYNRSHLFVLSSVTASDGDEESQGLVLQEAQACGIPVVATQHNGFPEGVLDGKSGFIVPQKDIEALSDKIEYLINHPEIWPEMGRSGRKFVEQKYDVELIADKLVRIYEDLLKTDSIDVRF